MEKELIKKIIAGNQKAIKEFYRKYQPRLLNFILQKVKRCEDAEDILQDTMISVIDSLPLFRGDSSLYTFLCSIAGHEISDFYRKKKIKNFLFSHFPKIEHIVENLASQVLSPERVFEEKELKGEIIKTFMTLSEGYSKILRLKYIDGLSYGEISTKLKKSVKAVESKLARARQAFVQAWESRNYAKKGISSYFS